MTDTFLDRDRLGRNNFGALRLVLAIAVIVSHMFPAYGGELGKREPLVRLSGEIDIGGIAVNAFFAISGYLITLSWMRSRNFKAFLMKRVLRIYPGFLVASIVSLLIVAPLAGAKFSEAFTPWQSLKSLARLVLLSAPKAPGAFAGQPLDVLNLPLWTIRYEFLCYLLVPVLLLLALRLPRAGMLVVYLAILAWHASQGTAMVPGDAPSIDIPIVGSLAVWPRFLAYFAAGMLLAKYRQVIPYRGWIAALSAVLCIVTLRTPIWFLVIATAGVYLIFYVAYLQTRLPLHAIGERVDLSYGTYLYGWPVQLLLAMHLRDRLGIWTLAGISIVVALMMATMSWFIVEAPSMRKKAKLSPLEVPNPDMPSESVKLPPLRSTAA